MRRVRILMVVGLGLAVGGLGVLLGLTPGWRVFEEGIGQGWLFELRGPLPPPGEVAIVTLDIESAERLGLPDKLREWPRDVHARLIDRLAGAGASVLALDLIFEQPRSDPAEDAALARAIRAAGRVVLLELIRKHDRVLDADNGALAMVTTQRVVRPIPELAEPALAVAPFPLPKLPMRLNHFWAFIPMPEVRPTMPVAALRHHLRPYDQTWRGLITRAAANDVLPGPEMPLRARMAALRTHLVEQPSLGSELRRLFERSDAAPDERRAIRTLIDLFTGPDARWINFYGPPGAITTWPAHAVLDDEAFAALARDVEGRAVFIGLAELHSDHEDDFQTVYSEGGVDLAGVEIAATIFANFLEARLLEPLAGWQLGALLLVYGIAIASVSSLLPALLAVPAALGISFAYGWLALAAFTDSLWLPIAIPLLVQLPLGLFGGLFLQYRAARHGEQNLVSGLAHYLPPTLASALAEEPDAASRTELVDGVCFVSDIEHFTRLAEKRSASEVSRLLNRYFDVAFDAIRAERGTVTDIVGDGVTAFWWGKDAVQRLSACRAALAVERAVERLETPAGEISLPTRIGLNSGRVVVGGVGGSGRFAYSVIGDPVNTASRIETLNKHLGTRLIAAAEVVQGLDDLMLRPLGDFVLYGRDGRMALVEIVDPEVGDRALLGAFGAALEVFRSGSLDEAKERFAGILERSMDGPSRFYLRLCRGDPDLPARCEPDGLVRLLEK